MRLRFTIRDLFWLTLVVALIPGWWVEHRSWKMVDPILVDTGPPIMRTYQIKHWTAISMFRTLDTSMAGNPNVKLSVDSKTNTVIVEARPQPAKGNRQIHCGTGLPNGIESRHSPPLLHPRCSRLTLVAALATGWWIDTRPTRVLPPLISVFPPPAPEYDHAKVSKAAKDYVFAALQTDDPLSGLQGYLEKLTADGWLEADVAAVRSKCESALWKICDIPLDLQ